MARTRAQQRNNTKLFTPIDGSVKPITRRMPPQNKHRQEIINDPNKRKAYGEILSAFSQSFTVKRVESNAELIDRLTDYFDKASLRAFPPTIEEMALYCGMSAKEFTALRTGARKGFSDQVYPGCTTVAVTQKAVDIIIGADSAAASAGDADKIFTIFKLCNYCPDRYSQRNTVDITAKPFEPEQNTMTRQQIEEIAMNLPDAQLNLMED